MAKTGQYRYYKDGDRLNSHKNLTYEKIVSGAWLDDNTRFVRLSIDFLIFFVSYYPFL